MSHASMQNVCTVQVFRNDRVKPFYGSLEEATVLAQVDYKQFVVHKITAYRGDTKFLLEYEDGAISWCYNGSHGTKAYSIASDSKVGSIGLKNSC